MDIKHITSHQPALRPTFVYQKVSSHEYCPNMTCSMLEAFAEVRSNPALCQQMLGELVQKKGYTLQEIADVAGVSVRTIERLLRGFTRRPNLIITITIFVLYYRKPITN